MSPGDSYEAFSEASLSRLFTHIGGGQPFAILTGFRDERTLQDNLGCHFEIKARLSAMGLSFVPVRGESIVPTDDQQDYKFVEETLFVFGYACSENKLRRVAQKMGVEYEQDGVLFRNDAGQTMLISTRDDGPKGEIGTMIPLGEWATSKLPEYLMELKNGRDFTLTAAGDYVRNGPTGLIQHLVLSATINACLTEEIRPDDFYTTPDGPSLSRFYSHVHDTRLPLAIMTGFVDASTLQENLARNLEIKASLQSMGLGFIAIKGRFVEQIRGGDSGEVKEEMLIVVGRGGKADQLRRISQKMGVIYEQDRVLFKDENGTLTVISTRNDGHVSGFGVAPVIRQWSLSKLPQYFGELKGGRKFLIEEIGDLYHSPSSGFNGFVAVATNTERFLED